MDSHIPHFFFDIPKFKDFISKNIYNIFENICFLVIKLSIFGFSKKVGDMIAHIIKSKKTSHKVFTKQKPADYLFSGLFWINIVCNVCNKLLIIYYVYLPRKIHFSAT